MLQFLLILSSFKLKLLFSPVIFFFQPTSSLCIENFVDSWYGRQSPYGLGNDNWEPFEFFRVKKCNESYFLWQHIQRTSEYAIINIFIFDWISTLYCAFFLICIIRLTKCNLLWDLTKPVSWSFRTTPRHIFIHRFSLRLKLNNH